MSETGIRVLIGAAALVAGAGGYALWSANTGGGDRAATETIVREYILANPEILPEAMRNLQGKEAAKQVSANRSAIETPYGKAWEGAADADVTLVEFFDYACGYCRQAVADVDRLLAEDKKLKVVYHEMPVLGEQSIIAARHSIALAKSGNFIAFHKALYGAGRPTDAGIAAAVTAAGADPATIRAAAMGKDVEEQLGRAVNLQRQLGLDGTPAWVVGDKVISGAVGYEALKKAIADARAAKGV